LTTAFSEPRFDSRHRVVLTAILPARHHRCYFRLRLLALPQPLAFRLALRGHLSILRWIDSNNRLATTIRHTLPMLFPGPLPDHSGFSFRQISHTVSVRSGLSQGPLPLCIANTLDAFLNRSRRTCPLYIFSTCNRAAPQFSSYVLPALFHLRLSA